MSARRCKKQGGGRREDMKYDICKSVAQRASLCAKTGEEIKMDEICWWVKQVGVFKEKPTDQDVEEVRRNRAEGP